MKGRGTNPCPFLSRTISKWQTFTSIYYNMVKMINQFFLYVNYTCDINAVIPNPAYVVKSPFVSISIYIVQYKFAISVTKPHNNVPKYFFFHIIADCCSTISTIVHIIPFRLIIGIYTSI